MVLQTYKNPPTFKYRQQFFIRRWEQLLIANDKKRLRWVVLVLSQDGDCINLFENHSENSLKEDISNVTTFNPPLFSLVNTFKNS